MQTWLERAQRQLVDLEHAAKHRRKQREEQRQPLRVKLDKVIRELPPERAAAGLPIAFFVEQTSPRWRGKHANVRDIGTALRAMGWTRVRRWRADLGGFRALWYPPADHAPANPIDELLGR